jgi:long-chain acyl-CoA synthetase
MSAPGQPFEVVERVSDGVTNRVFKNAPETLRDFFATSRGLNETFIVYEDEEWTFDEVMKEVDALAYALVHHYEIEVGDRVGIAMRNLPEWVISFAAIVSIGAISVSLNAWWTEEELDYAINDSQLSLLIADSDRVARAQHVCQHAGVRLLGVRLDELDPLGPGVELWNNVLVRGATMPEVPLTSNCDATILYTSGTTGVPKGAVSTHGAICQTIMAFLSSSTINGSRRGPSEPGASAPTSFILIVPLFHVTGCIAVMMGCFSWHLKLVMMHRWEPERALELIERHRVTNFIGVPTQSWDLLESPNFSHYDTSSLTAVGGGGAPAPPALVARVEQSFEQGRPSLGYGMTETNAFGMGIYGDEYVTHPTSTGNATNIVMDVEIRDDQGQVLAVNEHGEIWLKSPTLIRGYWNKPEATAQSIVAGWLRTGGLRAHRRRWLPLRRGPTQGHDLARGGERVLRRGRGRDLRTADRLRGGRLWSARRTPGRRGGLRGDVKTRRDLGRGRTARPLTSALGQLQGADQGGLHPRAPAAKPGRQVLKARDAEALLLLNLGDGGQGVGRDVEVVEFADVEPGRVVGRAVHFMA